MPSIISGACGRAARTCPPGDLAARLSDRRDSGFFQLSFLVQPDPWNSVEQNPSFGSFSQTKYLLSGTSFQDQLFIFVGISIRYAMACFLIKGSQRGTHHETQTYRPAAHHYFLP
jgi:hypothetical protein